MSLATKARMVRALGLSNVARVALYRLGLKSGLHPVLRLSAAVPEGPFFDTGTPRETPPAPPRESWREGSGLAFGRAVAPLDEPPDFLRGVDGARPWHAIPDFDPAVGDIKRVWEYSRLDWIVPMAQRGETARIDRWLTHWLAQNPPYRGPNWKCGQEASLRVLHLALAASLTGIEAEAGTALGDLLHLHARRIAPTMGYAIGQANNHGTSEAGALFVAGMLLGEAKWERMGRHWLEDRARRLIAPDGSFSQYSVVYHRLMLQTYGHAELWRRRCGRPAFSPALHERLAAATHWLAQMTDPASGDAPNLGANDGADILKLTDADYRDFRPALTLSATLWGGAAGEGDAGVAWLGLEAARPSGEPLASETFDDGGYHVLRTGEAAAYLRYPRFDHRPSQADALHCDLWVRGRNLVRDGGSYSYNVSDADTAYFSGTASHSTAMFDGRDQMPRAGRFLFRDWLRAEDVQPVAETGGTVTAAAAYTDGQGARHARRLVLEEGRLVCTDEVSGFAERAVLRWRLAPGEWQLDGDTVTGPLATVRVEAEVPVSLTLTTGKESRYYLKKTPLPVFEARVARAATVVTTIRFASKEQG